MSAQQTAYEPMTTLLWQMAVQRLPADTWVVDVGANVGHFACIAAKLNKRVIAFEPREDPFNELRRRLTQITNDGVASRRAVSDRQADDVKLHFAPERKYTASLKPEVWRTSYALVKTTTLDFELLYSPTGVIKIDVEGAESDVIRGARKTILRDRPTIFIEVLNNVIGSQILFDLPPVYVQCCDIYRIYEREMCLEETKTLTVGDGWGNFMFLPVRPFPNEGVL